MRKTILSLLIALVLAPVGLSAHKTKQWTAEQAWEWHKANGWRIGCNYVPSYAINQYEIWGEDTFDPEMIERDMTIAEGLGFNSIRIYLAEGLWYADKKGFKSRINIFLDILERHGMKAIFTFFTNGGNLDYDFKVGKQPEPMTGIHGSGYWIPCPGRKVINDPAEWPKLKKYVQDILRTYKNDDRILYWCLCNEPENIRKDCDLAKLMPEIYKWAWEVRPSQPLSSPVWNRPGFKGTTTKLDLVAWVCENSDIITFHCYYKPEELKIFIKMLQRFGRPMVCQEYLARNFGNNFFNITPILKKEGIGAINWGLINNRNNYHYPWGHKPEDGEPEVWFHDIFRKDLTPYDPKEIEFLKKITKK